MLLVVGSMRAVVRCVLLVVCGMLFGIVAAFVCNLFSWGVGLLFVVCRVL